jgi:hypothetical protein
MSAGIGESIVQGAARIRVDTASARSWVLDAVALCRPLAAIEVCRFLKRRAEFFEAHFSD